LNENFIQVILVHLAIRRIKMKFIIHDCEIALLASFAAVVIGFSACRDTSNPVTKLDDIVFPDSNISYAKLVQPLFFAACASAACHEVARKGNADVGGNDNLDLTLYAGLWKADNTIITPPDTSNSILVWCIEWRPVVNIYPMPPTKQLSPNQIRGIKRWIFEGARDTP
jgi:hypothetical protein